MLHQDLLRAQRDSVKQTATLHADPLRHQIHLYEAQNELGKSPAILLQAVTGLGAKIDGVGEKLDRLNDGFDRLIDLVEKFLAGGFGNGRGGTRRRGSNRRQGVSEAVILLLILLWLGASDKSERPAGG